MKIRKGKKALILGGGAPNATLMSGALLAFGEQGVEFDVYSCTGAGATIGLLYLAPTNGLPLEAMRHTLNFGVSDAIYEHMPVNYKVFNKPGEGADHFRRLMALNPFLQMAHGSGNSDWSALLQDWSALMVQSLSPSSLKSESKGLCAHVPFITDVVDFLRVQAVKPDVYINAYNITDHCMETWGKHEITPEHYQAALSFPFLYPPCELNGKLYYEGAIMDCLNYQPFTPGEGAHADVETIVVLDVLGDPRLIREPRNLWDAYVVSIIAPLVEVARDDTELYQWRHNRNWLGRPIRRVLQVPFEIPEDYYCNVLDWSRSNLRQLFKIGYNAGLNFCRRHASQLDIEFDPAFHPMED